MDSFDALIAVLIKYLRVVFEMTQEEMAESLGISLSMLRKIEQRAAPISFRVQARLQKWLPEILSKRPGLRLELFNTEDQTKIAGPDWESVLKSIRSLSPESIEENQISEMARKLYIFFPRNSLRTDESGCTVDESRYIWLDPPNDGLMGKKSIRMVPPCFTPVSNKDDACDDLKSEVTAEMNAALVDRLNKEAEKKGLTFSELLELIATYYFESKRLFTNDGNPSK